jgi:putative oxidoreductase
MKNYKLLINWVARLMAAFILLQTLYFKFTGAEESVYIFTELGMEPWGRFGVGFIELVASVLILIPAFTGTGALIGCGLMVGAIFSHITVLGMEVQGDGGLLFSYAIIVSICCTYLAIENRKSIPIVKNLIR